MRVVRRVALVTLSAVLASGQGARIRPAPAAAPAPFTATVRIDATKVANRISPQLYGHFLEFMFEGIKFGLHAELLKNRGFEEAATVTGSVTGLPRDWEREPNDRNAQPARQRALARALLQVVLE